MRTQRNKLLGESDFRVLPDYEKDKDLWIQYRKKLRNLPATWVDGMDFPSPPYNPHNFKSIYIYELESEYRCVVKQDKNEFGSVDQPTY